ncbi:TolC family protein [Nafulsella turpanensis]|uniref:TolC family protein n=1 Tax=Nafulsella turpanensis TaxID=1265690 RepID=UPI00034CBB91|nr:TolC family protein [Nafulsella turpanensis]
MLLLFTGIAVSLKAQQAAPKVFTLEECVAYAIENNVAVKNEVLNEGIARAQIGETIAQGLPQITGSGNLTYNAEIATSFLPLRAFDPTAPEGAYRPVQFGIPYQSSASINATQLIFSGSYFVGLRASKVFKELAEKDVVKAKTDVAEGVALAYYGVLVAQERLELLKANLGRLESLYTETKAMNEQGFVEAIDVQRIQVNLNNLEAELNNVQRALEINMNALKFQMGLPLDLPIELAQDIKSFEEVPQLVEEEVEFADRIEYQQLRVTRELAGLDIKNTQSQYLPTLSAFANLGWNAGKPELGQLFEATPDFYIKDENDQDVLVEAHTWNRFAAVGISLNVPIFDGLLKANTIRRKKLIAEQVDNQIRNLESAIEMEIEQARIVLKNSLQTLDAQQENRALAEEVYRVTKIKYQEGVGSNLEVIEAENALKTAETNYFQALYDALVARVAYKKATGTLFPTN